MGVGQACRRSGLQAAGIKATGTPGYLLPTPLPAHKPVPADTTLQRTLRALEPHIAQCSTSALCNLLWALGRTAGVASGTIKAKRQRSVDGDWISTPVGAELLALASATTAELARRKLKLHELAAAATAVAAHAEHAAELPTAPVAALRRACTAAAVARGLSPADLAHVAGAAARLRWQDAELVDALANDMQARGSSCPSEVGGVLSCLGGKGSASAKHHAAAKHCAPVLCVHSSAPWTMQHCHTPCPPAGVHPVRVGASHPGAQPLWTAV